MTVFEIPRAAYETWFKVVVFHPWASEDEAQSATKANLPGGLASCVAFVRQWTQPSKSMSSTWPFTLRSIGSWFEDDEERLTFFDRRSVLCHHLPFVPVLFRRNERMEKSSLRFHPQWWTSLGKTMRWSAFSSTASTIADFWKRDGCYKSSSMTIRHRTERNQSHDQLHHLKTQKMKTVVVFVALMGNAIPSDLLAVRFPIGSWNTIRLRR